MRVLFVTVLLLSAGFAAAEPSEFENAHGWKWALEPISASFSATSAGGILVLSHRADGGAYGVTFGMKTPDLSEYRAIVFDAQGKRYTPQYDYSAGTEGMGIVYFCFDPDQIAYDNVAHVGLEVLPPEGRAVASHHAISRARELGITVMPYPMPDQIYKFELTGLDGRPVKSADYLGRVLLLDFWATWCVPCMKGLPKIQSLKTSAPAGRFEVVGINFDFAVEQLRKALDEKKLEWPTVHIQPGPELMDLWYEAAGMRSLPRYVVLDEKGVVRLDTGDADKVVENVKALLGMD